MTGSEGRPSRLSRRWRAIADALLLRAEAPARIALPSGEEVEADVLLRDFGARCGMLLVTDDEVVWRHRASLLAAGYGFSVLKDPGKTPDLPLRFEGVIQLLQDWGWTGALEDEPAWMRGGART